MANNMTEEEMMAVNCSFEIHRKAVIRAGRHKKYIIEQAGKAVFIQECTLNDNMINRWISTSIAVSESKDELMAFCHKLYGAEVEFDDKDHSKSFDTDMGVAYFSIKQVALV